MPDTGNAKDCLELPPTNFSIFTLKNVTWRTYLIIFSVQYCFPFRFVCIELVSLIWFLQIWVAIYVYGTMINWSTLIKKLMQTYIVIASCTILNVSTVHLNGIFTPHMTLSLETCIRGRPSIKRTLQHSARVSALIQVSLYILWSDKMELRTRVTCLNVKLRQWKYGIQTVNLEQAFFFDRRL